MKTKIIAIFCVLLSIMLASTAFASLSVTDFTLGDDSSERNNPEGEDDEDQEGSIESATFTVNNNGTTDITGIELSFGSLVNEYNLTFSETSAFDLSAGSSKVITVTGIISDKLGSLVRVDNDDEDEEALTAGNFFLSGTNGTDIITAPGTMFAQAEPGLDINNIEIIIDGDAFDADDDEVEEIPPGSSVVVRFEIENNFDDDSNLDIEGDISLDSDNSDAEFDDSSEDLDVNTEDEETYSFDMDIDWGDVEDGDDATLEIEIEGDDKNNARHVILVTLDIQFEYADAEIEVNGFSFSDFSVCPGERVEFSYEIENTGTDDQDNMITRLRSNLLGIEVLSNRFDIDGRDDEDTESRFLSDSFEIPDDAEARTYDFNLEIFYEDEDGDDTSEFQSFPLTVEDCSSPSNGGSSSSNGGSSQNTNTGSSNGFVTNPVSPTPSAPAVTTPTTDSEPTTSTVVTAQPRQSGNVLQTIGIILLVLILLGIVIVLAGVLLRK